MAIDEDAKRMDAGKAAPSSRICAGYLLLQGLAGGVWWICLLCIPASRAYFKPTGAGDWTILSFWFPDLLLFVVGSIVTAWLLFRGSGLGRPALWFTAGAVSYAALYCVGLSLLTRSAWLGSGAMLPTMCLTLWISIWCEVRWRQ
jgi:hypothetical protein